MNSWQKWVKYAGDCLCLLELCWRYAGDALPKWGGCWKFVWKFVWIRYPQVWYVKTFSWICFHVVCVRCVWSSPLSHTQTHTHTESHRHIDKHIHTHTTPHPTTLTHLASKRARKESKVKKIKIDLRECVKLFPRVMREKLRIFTWIREDENLSALMR